MFELAYALRGKRVWIAGHRGMVGAALLRQLRETGADLLTVERATADLRRQDQVERYVAAAKPHAVFIAAATVGGILANDTRPAEFIHDNLTIVANIIEACARSGVEKLMVLGSSCIYPRLAEQPMTEAGLLGGALEPTNQWYAVAKIAGIKLAQAYRRQYGRDFIAVVPTNLYGPGDNFDLAASHVIPALLRKCHEAKTTGGPVEIWGTGAPRREFLYVDDAADALVFLMERYSAEDIINVGGGDDVSIRELADVAAAATGYGGGFKYATDKPDGMPLKRLDATRLMALGWRQRTGLKDGLRRTYDWFRQLPSAPQARHERVA
ncbi:MAG: GDP-L-fucose synthase [Alphaproteobacteria bacterium]|nr:GDP-L-fucose synthase [Alphaproteobacteria bacterium]